MLEEQKAGLDEVQNGRIRGAQYGGHGFAVEHANSHMKHATHMEINLYEDILTYTLPIYIIYAHK